MATTEQEARRIFGDYVGPREIGKVYRSGYGGEPYTVLGITYGTEATRAAIGWDSGWSMTVVGDDGRVRTHCTRWDARRDSACLDICPCLHPYAGHHDAACPHCDCPRFAQLRTTNPGGTQPAAARTT
ncbi:hypothetical protein ABR738_01270 [Streptomyces sp. Edi4]|uniref:hypothetical protein n=1 Tax=Streptomyces sp. Edi4 TaxID=3162527 RepID=UPI0033059114